jgi:hypothetical protein
MKHTGDLAKTQPCHAVPDHAHKHDPDCGHKAVKHDDHTDYEHDGQLHRIHNDHIDKCDGSDPNSGKLAQDALKIIQNK